MRAGIQDLLSDAKKGVRYGNVHPLHPWTVCPDDWRGFDVLSYVKITARQFPVFFFINRSGSGV